MADIVLLQDDDAQLERFWQLRLRALQDAPQAFGSAYEESAQTPMAELIARQRSRMSADNVVFMAEEDGAFIGSTGLYRETRVKTAHQAHIWGVFVLPEQRGRGLARALMTRAIAHARTFAGVELLHLTVVTSNAPAVHLYESLGFVSWGTQPKALHVDGQYYDEYHMALGM